MSGHWSRAMVLDSINHRMEKPQNAMHSNFRTLEITVVT